MATYDEKLERAAIAVDELLEVACLWERLGVHDQADRVLSMAIITDTALAALR